MHEVRRSLVEQQAMAARLPLQTADIPWPCTNAEYETVMHSALAEAQAQLDITHIAFGDLYLEEIRAYRETLLANHANINSLYPVWGLPTDRLAREMISGALRRLRSIRS
jgi:diphthamide synthase (EF-2-diphthine--ammonia ligase)